MVSAGLFAIGLFGALTRKNAVAVLMGIELMLNAVNLNAVALWRFVSPTVAVEAGGASTAYLASVDGQIFAVFVIALAAAEAAVGLALIIAIYRLRKSVELDQFSLMNG
ncbi:MAG: NADH-quinone oxidoreductase subunit NuoK [Chloroflexi bacterium CFX6]|nr:NADH-quinone oxidoreductase subunit NuoK [Chloroflexi bacterium CFX6]